MGFDIHYLYSLHIFAISTMSSPIEVEIVEKWCSSPNLDKSQVTLCNINNLIMQSCSDDLHQLWVYLVDARISPLDTFKLQICLTI